MRFAIQVYKKTVFVLLFYCLWTATLSFMSLLRCCALYMIYWVNKACTFEKNNPGCNKFTKWLPTVHSTKAKSVYTMPYKPFAITTTRVHFSCMTCALNSKPATPFHEFLFTIQPNPIAKKGEKNIVIFNTVNMIRIKEEG